MKIEKINFKYVYQRPTHIDIIFRTIKNFMKFYAADGQTICIVLNPNDEIFYFQKTKSNRYEIFCLSDQVYSYGEFSKEVLFDIGKYLRQYLDKKINNKVINEYLN